MPSTSLIALGGGNCRYFPAPVPCCYNASFYCSPAVPVAQMGGFLGMAVCYLAMGGLMGTLEGNVPLFFLFYGLSFFFSNCGPNTTTFVLPSEVFPTEVRATCHGISAAAGKIGAVVGGAALRPVLDSHGLGTVMVVCGAVALLGFACTYALIEVRAMAVNHVGGAETREA